MSYIRFKSKSKNLKEPPKHQETAFAFLKVVLNKSFEKFRYLKVGNIFPDLQPYKR